ncbi:MAG: type II toxin-antitoxin system VapC family toxin, partial [Candidatus Dormibacteraceae bacterium]
MSNPLTPGTVPAASVLDATCLLALLLKEPGAAVVAAVLNHRALISAVNYHEVVAKLVDRGMTSSAINDALQLPFELIDFDEEQAMAAGLLRATTRSFGLSAGDRACLALALAYSLPALT